MEFRDLVKNVRVDGTYVEDGCLKCKIIEECVSF